MTGSPASLSPSSPASPPRLHTFYSNYRSQTAHRFTPEIASNELSSSPPSFSLYSGKPAIPIPSKNVPLLPTPPPTPEDTPIGNNGSFGNISAKQSSAALDFLTTLFPRSSLTALPYTKSVSITSPALKAVWEGIILDIPGGHRTLYVHGKGAEHMELRERLFFFMLH